MSGQEAIHHHYAKNYSGTPAEEVLKNWDEFSKDWASWDAEHKNNKAWLKNTSFKERRDGIKTNEDFKQGAHRILGGAALETGGIVTAVGGAALNDAAAARAKTSAAHQAESMADRDVTAEQKGGLKDEGQKALPGRNANVGHGIGPRIAGETKFGSKAHFAEQALKDGQEARKYGAIARMGIKYGTIGGAGLVAGGVYEEAKGTRQRNKGARDVRAQQLKSKGIPVVAAKRGDTPADKVLSAWDQM